MKDKQAKKGWDQYLHIYYNYSLFDLFHYNFYLDNM